MSGRDRRIRFLSVVLAVVMATAGFRFFTVMTSKAATFGWIQSDWSDGADVGAVADHNSDREGWTKYASADAGIDVTGSPGDIRLSYDQHDFVGTSDTDFAPGVFSDTRTEGTGSDAGIGLDLQEVSEVGKSWRLVPASTVGIYSPAEAAFETVESEYLFTFRGGHAPDFYRRSLADDPDQWTVMASSPAEIYRGSDLLYVENSDYLYAFAGSSKAFLRYSISGNSWSTMASIPSDTSYGASLSYPGSGDYLYATRGNRSSDFYRYSISGNSWETLTAVPEAVYSGGSLLCLGDDYVYAIPGNASASFFRYSISGGSWETLTSAPDALGGGASLAYPGSGDYIYTIRGNGSGALYGYSISGNVWVILSSLSYTIYSGKIFFDRNGEFRYYDGKAVFTYSVDVDSWSDESMSFFPGPAGGNGLRSVSTGDGYVYGARMDSVSFFGYSLIDDHWDFLSPVPRYFDGDGGSLASDGDSIYALTGGDSAYFYRYDTAIDAWTQMASLPANAGRGASLVYPGSGDYVYAMKGGYGSDFYRYSISGNFWSRMANMPGGIATGASLSYPGSGDYLYATRGWEKSDFYRYSISSDSWASLSPTPGTLGSSGSGIVFSDPNQVYVLSGNYNTRDFYRYSVARDEWALESDYLSGYGSTGSVYYDGSIYAFSYVNDASLYRYDIVESAEPDIWERAGPTYENYVMDGAVYYDENDSVYVHRQATAEFYRYGVSDGSWEPLASAPASLSSQTSDFMTLAGDFVYVFQGNSNAFYRYSIVDDSWSIMANFPETVQYGGALAYSGTGDHIYAAQGNSNRAYRYSISGNSWEAIANLTQDFKYAVSMEAVGEYVYAIKANSALFARYSVSNHSWEEISPVPMYSRGNNALIYPGSGDYLYAYSGQTAFSRYSISGNAWTALTSKAGAYRIGAPVSDGSDGVLFFGDSIQRYHPERDLQGGWVPVASAPGNIGIGGSLVSVDSGRFIYATQGNGSSDFYRYSVADDSWGTMAFVPGTMADGGMLAYPGSGDYIYAIRGKDGNEFYRYSIAGDSWTTMTSLPANLLTKPSIAFSDPEHLYCVRGLGSGDVYVYSVADDSWEMADRSWNMSGGALAYPGFGNRMLYLSKGGFYWYSLLQRNWNYFEESTPDLSLSAAAVSPSGEMYFVSSDSKSFVRFSMDAGYFKAMSPLPSGSGGGVGLVFSGDDVYVTAGGGTDKFYRFSPRGYRSSGTYVSAPQDLGLRSDLDSVMLGTTLNGQAVSVDVRGGDSAVPDETWTEWVTDASGLGDPAVIQDKRYLQYRVNLSTADPGYTPYLDDVTLSYSAYQTDQELVSSVYDSTDAANLVNDIFWTETVPSQTDIGLQLRSSADNVTWSGWQGPDGTSATFFDKASGGNTIPASLGSVGSNRYLQYRIVMTTDGSVTPSLSDLTVRYVVNAPPEISSVSVAQSGPSETVVVEYSILDTDTDSGSYTPNFVTPSFEYSTDGGMTWEDIGEEYYEFDDAPFLGEVSDTNSDGEADNRVLPGAALDYSILWDAQRQLGVATDVSGFLVRVTVDDNELANNIVSAVSDPYPVDTRAVSNVSAVQSDEDGASDGSVVVSYSYAVQDSVRDVVSVSLQYRSGTEWLDATTVSGDIGAGIVSGDREIVWDAKTDDPERYDAGALVRVVATYGSTTQPSESDGYLLDTRKPVIDGVSVDLQEDLLTITAPIEDSTYDIYLSVGGEFPDTPQFPDAQDLTYPYTFNYAELSTITVSGTVSMKIIDRYGNVSLPYSYATPLQPQHLVFFDISDADSGIFSELLTWRSMNAADLETRICRAEVPDGAPVLDSSSLPYDTCWTIPNVIDNFRIDNDLDGDTHYYYRVYTRNKLDGSVSNLSNVVDDTPNGNGSSDSTPPSIYDIALDEENDVTATSIRLTWKADEPSDSGIGYTPAEYYDEDGYARETVNHSSQMVLGGEEHSYTLTGLVPDSLYYLRVRSDDVFGNQGIAANWDSGDGSALIAVRTKDGPAIQKFIIKETSNTAVTIGWTTTTLSNSYIYYSKTVSEDGELVIDDPDVPTEESGVVKNDDEYVLEHTLTLDGLTPGDTYYFFLKSVGTNGNYAIENNAGLFYEFSTDSDSVPPSILFDAENQPFFRTDTQGGFQWTTDEPATTTFRYKKHSDDEYADYVFDQDLLNRSHSAYIQGLDPYTEYDYEISATDMNGNASGSIEGSFRTRLSPSEDHPPLSEIGNVRIPEDTLSDSFAVIQFETDQPAICLAEMTVSQGSYTNPVIVEEDGYSLDNGYCTQHAIRMINLIFSTPYYVTITCHDNLTDDEGYYTYVTSDEYSFVTREKLYTGDEALALGIGTDTGGDLMAPSISSVKVADVSGEAATITWKTDENSNSNAHFGIETPEESMAGDSFVNESVENFVTDHSVTITGLVPATEYRFKVSSVDASGNIGLSSESSFKTAAPSSISSIRAVSTDLSEAVITWETSKSTTSVVEYGTTNLYGERKESSSLTKEHEVRLSGLDLGVTYHFRVKGRDENGVFYSSSDNVFQPKSPPTITEVEVTDVTEREATVRFRTNVPTDGNITYTDPENAENSGYQGRPDLVTAHEIILRNLASGTTYSTGIKVRDEQGTESEIAGPSFTTGADDVPPQIDKVQVDSALNQTDKVQTIISWNTDEPSTSQVTYSERGSGEERTVGLAEGYSTTHTVVVTVFKPGTVYEFRIRSVDVAGNETVSKDFALLTPKQTQNIIQIIIGNFQDIFGWARM